jgi:hypothetical protein
MRITPVHILTNRRGDSAVIKYVNYGNAVVLQFIDMDVATATVQG